jgi:TM2 domain-containing membrane protein YozV/RNA polymerase subunit RPABC4/transcription elongation factor Spt4
MMSDKYYLHFKGRRVLGPFDVEQIRAMIRRAQITRTDELSPDGVTWYPAENFEGLFPFEEQPLDRPEGPPSEDAVWYAHINGESRGPVLKQELAAWFSSENLSSETMIFREGMDDWEPARDLMPELFPQKRGDEKPCPYCREIISSSAQKCPHCRTKLDVFCRSCGTQCHGEQSICLNCGDQLLEEEAPIIIEPGVKAYGSYSKTTAAILALLLGGLGAHKFYHGSFGYGLLYVLFVLTFIPAILAVIEAIVYLTMDTEEYDFRYNLTPPSAFKW